MQPRAQSGSCGHPLGSTPDGPDLCAAPRRTNGRRCPPATGLPRDAAQDRSAGILAKDAFQGCQPAMGLQKGHCTGPLPGYPGTQPAMGSQKASALGEPPESRLASTAQTMRMTVPTMLITQLATQPLRSRGSNARSTQRITTAMYHTAGGGGGGRPVGQGRR